MAIGALYDGLPIARYRDKIHEGIEEAFRFSSFYGTKEEIREKKPQDYDISDGFHELAMWWSKLPASTGARLPRNVEVIFEYVSANQKMPNLYNWFTSNGDKYAVISVAVIVPLACLWLVHWIPEDQVETYTHHCF